MNYFINFLNLFFTLMFMAVCSFVLLQRQLSQHWKLFDVIIVLIVILSISFLQIFSFITNLIQDRKQNEKIRKLLSRLMKHNVEQENSAAISKSHHLNRPGGLKFILRDGGGKNAKGS